MTGPSSRVIWPSCRWLRPAVTTIVPCEGGDLNSKIEKNVCGRGNLVTVHMGNWRHLAIPLSSTLRREIEKVILFATFEQCREKPVAVGKWSVENKAPSSHRIGGQLSNSYGMRSMSTPRSPPNLWHRCRNGEMRVCL